MSNATGDIRHTPETHAGPPGSRILVSAVDDAPGSRGAAAALACAAAGSDRAPLLIDVGGRPPRPTLLAGQAALGLEERLRRALPRLAVAARGQVCHVGTSAGSSGLEEAEAALEAAPAEIAVVHVRPAMFLCALRERPGLRPTSVVLRAEIGRDRTSLAVLVAALRGWGIPVGVVKKRLGWVAERRALFGALGPDAPDGLSPRLVRRALAQGRR